MAKTFTEVEIKKTPTIESPRRTGALIYDERPRHNHKSLLFGPLALLAAGLTLVLVTRRWLRHAHNGQQG